MRTMPLPRRDFLVVANPPFSLTTALCRRLLGDPAVPFVGAELTVQWGAARWLTAQRPRDAEAAWWGARYQIHMARALSPAEFVPPPRVHAAWLSVRPRPVPVSPRAASAACRRSSLRPTASLRPEPTSRSPTAGYCCSGLASIRRLPSLR